MRACQCIWYIIGCSSLLHCAQPIGALLLAAFVYYLAALELEGEEEVEVDDKS